MTWSHILAWRHPTRWRDLVTSSRVALWPFYAVTQASQCVLRRPPLRPWRPDVFNWASFIKKKPSCTACLHQWNMRNWVTSVSWLKSFSDPRIVSELQQSPTQTGLALRQLPRGSSQKRTSTSFPQKCLKRCVHEKKAGTKRIFLLMAERKKILPSSLIFSFVLRPPRTRCIPNTLELN